MITTEQTIEAAKRSADPKSFIQGAMWALDMLERQSNNQAAFGEKLRDLTGKETIKIIRNK